MIRCIFAENGPLEGGIESSFSDTGWGAKGDFRWIFDPNPYIFEGGHHHFPKAHALRYGHRKFGDDRMYIRGEWALKKMALNQISVVPAGALRVILDGFLTPTSAFSKGAPHHFPKAHALRYGHRQFGDDRVCIR